MMYPRLVLAKQFLSDDGIIFISIDDRELAHLRMVMDELYRPENLVACFVWQTEGNFDNQAKVKIGHEYVLAYTKNYALLPPPPVVDPNTPKGSKLFRDRIQNTIVKNGPANPVSAIILPAGFPANFQEGVITKRKNQWPHYSEDVIVKDYKLQKAVAASSGWSSKRIFERFIVSGFKPSLDTKGQETTFVLTQTGAIENIKQRPGKQSHVISVLREVGTTQQMSAALMGMGIEFDYPKPVGLIKYLVSLVSDKSCTVLDFFGGSGTTAHAVLELNKEDGGTRKFILVELKEDICRTSAKRLSSVTNGYSDSKEQIAGLGGGFRYCTLGTTLFGADGQIRDEVKFDDLARHVFFIETGEPLPKRANGKTPFIGTAKGVGVYLLYNGILGDKSPRGRNVLTTTILATLPKHDGPRVIYGTGCRISIERLRREGITFRQIPYQVKVS
jgi:hypothetical protein